MSSTVRFGVAGTAMIAVAFGFGRYGYGLFAPELIREFDLSVTIVGVIGSAPYAAYLVALTLVGLLSARLGPRPLVVTAGLATAAGTAMVAWAPGPVWVVVGLVVAGTASGWAWAPYADATERVVSPSSRDAVLGVVASGTAFGIAVAGALALVLADRWRVAWFAFSALALVVTIANARVVPAGPSPVPTPARQPLLRRAGVRLYGTASAYGFAGAVYWTFAVTVIERAVGSGAAVPAASWSVLGIAGTAAVCTGAVVTRIGLRATHTLLISLLAAAIALLGIAPGSLVAVGVSVTVYGATYMAVSGLLAMWSHRLDPRQPTKALSVTVFFLSIGAIPGPAVLGAFADRYGLRAAFLLTAAVTAATLVARPARPSRVGDSPSLHADVH